MSNSNIVQKNVYEIAADKDTLKKANEALSANGCLGILDSDTLDQTEHGAQVKIVVEKPIL